MNYNQLPSQDIVTKVITALKKNGIQAESAATAKDAKERVIALVPKNAEVITMTSITLDQTNIASLINESGDYNSVKDKLTKMDRATQNSEMQKLGAAPEYTLGSVHAVTEEGHIVIASNTGSQLPAYAYGSPNVIWVVSTKKIVKNMDEALKRIYDHIVPLESARARKAYNLPEFNTNVSKLLIVNREVNPHRIHLIFVNEDLGY